MSNYSLRDRRARRAFDNLLGGAIGDEPFWADYLEHVDRRNRVVHRGERVHRAGAQNSVQVAGQLLDYVAERWTHGG
jgi:hypothetical protein